MHRFYALDLKRGKSGHLGKQAMEVARLVNDDDCRFEIYGKNTGYTHASYMVNSYHGKVAC